MKRMAMTQEIRREWYEKRKGETSIKRPKLPFCSICSEGGRIKFLKPGEEVYKVEYRNGTHGYYHTKCIDNPERIDQEERVKRITLLDKDYWQGVNSFIKSLVDKKLGDKQIIDEVSRQFECSHITAWRRLRYFKQNFP